MVCENYGDISETKPYKTDRTIQLIFLFFNSK